LKPVRSTIMYRPRIIDERCLATYRTALVWAVAATAFVLPLCVHFETTEAATLIKIVVGQTLILATAAAWILYRAVRGTGPERMPSLLVPIAVYILVNAAAFVRAEDTYEAYIKLTQLVTAALLVCVVADVARESRYRERIVGAMVCAGFLASVYGIAQVLGYDVVDWTDKTGRISAGASTFGNKNFAAHFLVEAGFLGAGYALAASTARRRVLFGTALLVMLVHIVLTGTRAAYVAVAFGLALAAVCAARGIRRARHVRSPAFPRKKLLLAVAVLVAVSAAAGLAGQRVWDRFPTMLGPYRGSNLARLLTWRSTSRMILDHPVAGVGLGDYSGRLPPYMTVPHRHAMARRGVTVVKAHNEFLETAAETGVVGLLALFLVFSAAVVVGWRMLDGARDRDETTRAAGTLCCVAATGIQALFTFNLQNPASSFVFWLALGLLSAQELRAQSDPNPVLTERIGFGRLLPAMVLAAALLYAIPARYGILHADIALGRVEQRRDDGAYSNAIDVLDEALGFRYTSADAYFAAGTVRMLTGDSRSAAEMYRECLARRPHLVVALNNLGFVLLATGDVAGADESFIRAVELAPSLSTSWYGRGRCASLRADWQTAYTYLEKAATLGETGDQFDHTRARVLQHLGRRHEADRILHRLVVENPRWIDVREDFAALLLTMGRFDEAYAESLVVLAEDADRPRAHHAAAVALLGLGRDIDLAARHAAAFVEVESSTPIAGRLVREIVRVADLAQVAPERHDRTRYYLGKAFYAMGSPLAAADQLAKVGDKLPGDLLPDYVQLGEEVFRLADRPKEIDRLTRIKRRLDTR